MADVVTRREARRRKILENSKNRLMLITGESTELNNEIDQIVNNVPLNDSTIIENTQSNEIETFLVNAAKCLPENQANNHEYFLENLIVEQSALIESTSQEQSSTSNNANSSLLFAPYSKRIFIILLAIIIRFLFIFQMQFCVRDSIIYPFIIAEVTLQLLNKDSNNTINPLMSTLLLLSSLPPIQINRLLQIFKFLENLIRDFSLYFFTFLMVHLFIGLII